jgi:hypothetical protein
MPPDAALGYRFARAVLARDIPRSDHLRQEVISRWRLKGLVSLAFAVASSRVFPTLKYSLGYRNACERVTIAGVDAALHPDAVVR